MEDCRTDDVMTLERLVEENSRRNLEERLAEEYDPLHGIGCAYAAERVRVASRFTDGVEYVPPEMLEDADWRRVDSRQDWMRLRIRYDFEYWAAVCARIKHKNRAEIVPFVLNRGQRRVVEALEADRRAGRPMRMIVLKARQWGCTTVVEMYMAWVQCCLARNWHSLLCSQVQSVSSAIRNMLAMLLEHYPLDLWDGSEQGRPSLTAFQGQQAIREIKGRDCHLTLATSESVNSVRGSDYAMAHLTEVAFWKDTPSAKPEDFIRTICGAVARVPMTMVVMESTANGVGNFFHREWCRSERGDSDKRAVFVPWYEIEIYREEVADPMALWQAMDAYERGLWNDFGLSLERIQWYRMKRAEMADHTAFMAEYPTTPGEAFACTAAAVFSPEGVERLRPGCAELRYETGDVASVTGAVTGIRSLDALGFRKDSTGMMKLWKRPRAGGSYVVAVDVGGRTLKADWSVVAVFDTAGCDGRPEVVAQWRGHVDHDLLAWKGAQIARWYNTALLVFESNSMEHDYATGLTSDQGAYMLHELGEVYPNLYYRQSMGEDCGRKPGFHTNRATKQMIITELIAAVRDGTYIERDAMALDELSTYELRPNGSYAASDGHHDDILMTRAIGLHVARLPGVSLSVASDSDLASFIAPWQHDRPV